MTPRLTVACVYRTGGVYTEQDVVNLRDGVSKNLTAPYDFVCLSDTKVGSVPTIQLQHDWPGWWSKMELYGPLLHDRPAILYVDLDTVILRNIDWAVDHLANIVVLRDFNKSQLLATGLLFWRYDVLRHLYDMFCRSPEAFIERYRGIGISKGDQGFVQHHIGSAQVHCWQDMFPEKVVSHKIHCKEGVPDTADIVCFHGRVKPRDVPSLVS